MSSLAPIAARLAQIFSPRKCVLAASVLCSIGGLVTSQAHTLGVFLLGRAIQGIGGAGILSISFILVLELSGKKRRGLFIGLLNTGFTTGVAFGAVIAGALLSVTGWVCFCDASEFESWLTWWMQRFLFWVQTPFALIFGTGIFFSIPRSFTSGQEDGQGSIAAKLRRIDYLGAISLVSDVSWFAVGHTTNFTDGLHILISLRPIVA